MKKPVFFLPECDDAILLVNPRALFYVQRGGRVHSRFGHMLAGVNVNAPRLKSRLLAAAWQYIGTSDNFSLLDDDYVTYGCAFEYLFRVVGCGHCELCVHRKKLDFVNRCRMESECYTVPPYFFTLTYDNQHHPADGALHVRDVQLFFKRFRRRCERLHLPTDFRYCVAGEYGHKRGRPHYHVIMWNNPIGANGLDPFKDRLLCKMLHDAWQMDSWHVFSDSRNFNVCGDGAAAYCAKYIGKRSSRFYYKHQRPFILSSNRNGGIGAPFIKQYIEFFRSSYNQQFTYVSKIDFQVHTLTIGSYVKRWLWPSPSRLVSSATMFHYKDVSERLARWCSLGYDWNEAYEWLEEHRPCKNVVQHRLPPVEVVRDDKYLRWLQHKEVVAFTDYLDTLDIPEVDDGYIASYYHNASMSVSSSSDNRKSLQGKKMRLRQLTENQMHKSVL